MRMFLLGACAFVLLFAIQARAACCTPAPSDGTASTVAYVENGWFGEGLAIHLSTPLAFVTQCPAPAYDFALPASHPSYREVAAMILLAYASGVPVQLMVDPASCLFGGRTAIASVRLFR